VPVILYEDGSAMCEPCGIRWSDSKELETRRDPAPPSELPSVTARRTLGKKAKKDASAQINELMAELDLLSEEQFIISRPALMERYKLSKAELNKFWTHSSRSPKPEEPTADEKPPFIIHGTADDGLTYFTDQFGRIQAWRLESLGKEKLKVLGPFAYWYTHYSNGEKLSWDKAIEDIIQDGGGKAFDTRKLRGRGCWREE